MAWISAMEEMDDSFSRVRQLEEAVSEQTAELWMRSKLIFYTIFATTAARYLTIHNELSIITSSIMLLFLFYYLRTISKNLPYRQVSGFLMQTADMGVALFQIFAATSIGNSASSFLTTDGSFNVRSVNKIFILIMMVFVGILVLPKYFRVPAEKTPQ